MFARFSKRILNHVVVKELELEQKCIEVVRSVADDCTKGIVLTPLTIVNLRDQSDHCSQPA